uniref:Uncharacterized protein n=1 Tax=Oryza brachyantha TaxID=4533 RepID=J3LQ59_ORYBR
MLITYLHIFPSWLSTRLCLYLCMTHGVQRVQFICFLSASRILNLFSKSAYFYVIFTTGT